jgi:hypothetical protein
MPLCRDNSELAAKATCRRIPYVLKYLSSLPLVGLNSM